MVVDVTGIPAKVSVVEGEREREREREREGEVKREKGRERCQYVYEKGHITHPHSYDATATYDAAITPQWYGGTMIRWYDDTVVR